MKRKMIGALLSVAMIIGLAAGCGSDAKNGAEGAGGKYSGVELTYWSSWSNTEPQGKALQAIADAFEEETGATINIEWKGRDIKNIISAALEAEEKIDMFEEDYTRICKNYSEYLADLTEMAEEANYSDISYQILNDQVVEWAGFLCCLAEQPHVGGVFYNQDLFDKAGINTTPKTWDEFIMVCQKLVDAGYQPLALDSTYAPFFFGYHLARTIGEDQVAQLSKNGGWSDEPGAVKAAQEMIELVKAGYLAEGAPDEYPASQNKIGLTQDVAMVVCANYVTSEVNNTSGTELNWGLFNYPAVENGVNADSAYVGSNSIAITKYSDNKQAAFDFALYLTTGEYGQKLADEADQIPADPTNVAPTSQNGTIEVLENAKEPLSWNMGLNENADLISPISEVIIKLYEGEYDTGEEVTEALDALY